MADPMVLLCNPPSPLGTTVDRDAASGMGAIVHGTDVAPAPLTLAWSAAMLRDAGWPLRVIDATAERRRPTDLLNEIARLDPAVVILAASPVSAALDRPFLETLREQQPDLAVVLIGQAAHYLPPATRALATVTLAGEPTGAIDLLVERVLGDREFRGTITPDALKAPGYDARGHLRDLDALPAPAWEMFPVGRYGPLPVVASRGCRVGCRYCPVPVTQGRSWRCRDPETVAEEMHALHRDLGISAFRIADPLFGAGRHHALALCAAMIARGLPERVRWSCESRPERIDVHLLLQMRRAGCRTLHLGIETVSPLSLHSIGRVRGVRGVQRYLIQLRLLINACRLFGIRCQVHVLAGLPGDRAGAVATRTFLRAYPPDAIQIHPLVPYPGTSIFPTRQIGQEHELLEGAHPAPRHGQARPSSSPQPRSGLPTP